MPRSYFSGQDIRATTPTQLFVHGFAASREVAILVYDKEEIFARVSALFIWNRKKI